MSQLYQRALAEMESARAMLATETAELRREIVRLTATVEAKETALAAITTAVEHFAAVVELGTAFVATPHSQPATAPVSPLTPDSGKLPSIIQAAVAVLTEANGESVDNDRLASAVAVRRRGLTTKKNSVVNIMLQTIKANRVPGLEKVGSGAWRIAVGEPRAQEPAGNTDNVESVEPEPEPEEERAVIVDAAACKHEWQLGSGIEASGRCRLCGAERAFAGLVARSGVNVNQAARVGVAVVQP